MDQTINIADLVKTKFQAGQEVFLVTRDYRGTVESILPKRILATVFTVKTEYNARKPPNTTRSVSLLYDLAGSGNLLVTEDRLVASLDELRPEDRKPNLL